MSIHLLTRRLEKYWGQTRISLLQTFLQNLGDDTTPQQMVGIGVRLFGEWAKGSRPIRKDRSWTVKRISSVVRIPLKGRARDYPGFQSTIRTII